MTAKNCLGHYYIEEGQATYMEHIPFSHKKIPLIDKLKNNGYLNDSYVKLPYFKLGALGCTLSHVLILEEFVKSNMERITVFEDDVFLMYLQEAEKPFERVLTYPLCFHFSQPLQTMMASPELVVNRLELDLFLYMS